ncbi:MAG: nucleoside phosphorylase [Flavobacteriaceae bacterium]|nr:nucleoside phosphorylase [Flavobacteriaceae bacterium]
MNEAELILNDDGSIYHLGIRPEHCAPLIITVGDPDRVPTVSQFFDRIDFTNQKREICIHTGVLGNRMVSVISTGMGTDNIDIVFNELDALFTLDLNTGKPLNSPTPLTFIRLGTSGAIQANIELDSLVVAEAAIGFDNLMHYYDPSMCDHPFAVSLLTQLGISKKFNHPYYTEGNSVMINDCEKLGMSKGIIATNPGFYAPQGRQLRTKNKLPFNLNELTRFSYKNALITNFDMETAGIYGLSQVLGHRAISLSAILANRFHGTFSDQPDKTVYNMIERVTNAIKKGFFL